MPKDDHSVIRLTINRCETEIPVNSILYASVTDKLCTIHFTSRQQVSLFLTIGSLHSMLPPDQFVQISRSILVSLRHIQRIENPYVILFDQTRLRYSHSRKDRIYYIFRQYVKKHHSTDLCTPDVRIFLNQFQCLDHCPLPFFILEVTSDDADSPSNFIIRYANDAVADLIGLPHQMILNYPMHLVLKNNIADLLSLIISVALHGNTINEYLDIYSRHRYAHIFCYQPYPGYCACILTPMTES